MQMLVQRIMVQKAANILICITMGTLEATNPSSTAPRIPSRQSSIGDELVSCIGRQCVSAYDVAGNVQTTSINFEVKEGGIQNIEYYLAGFLGVTVLISALGIIFSRKD